MKGHSLLPIVTIAFHRWRVLSLCCRYRADVGRWRLAQGPQPESWIRTRTRNLLLSFLVSSCHNLAKEEPHQSISPASTLSSVIWPQKCGGDKVGLVPTHTQPSLYSYRKQNRERAGKQEVTHCHDTKGARPTPGHQCAGFTFPARLGFCETPNQVNMSHTKADLAWPAEHQHSGLQTHGVQKAGLNGAKISLGRNRFC